MYRQLFIFFFSLFPLLGYAEEKIALVSMAPYIGMCDQLTDKQVRCEVLVPPGFSSHTYEPTPKQILKAGRASIWFSLGELFEARVRAALEAENPKLVIVDLRQGLDLITAHGHEDHCHGCGAADTHIWMSPKMMMVQVELMAKSLEARFPDLAPTIQKNRGPLLAKIDALDKEIEAILKSHKGEVVYVSHPAYGYFCREFGIEERSIEFEGKDPTPKKLFTLVEMAKKDKVSTIFIQKQYSTKAAELVAHELGAKLVLLDPYSEDYFGSMKEIALQFAGAK